MSYPFNRHVGMLVLEVVMSNPNGDPEMESEPRIRELDGLGLISPPSIKRKYRDLVQGSAVMDAAREYLKLGEKTENNFDILERRGRDRKKITAMQADEFKQKYWDARLFGNTFLESIEKKDKEAKGRKKKGELEHLINTGVLQIGVGLSVAPVQIERMTFTNKPGVEEGKDRGMAPLAFRVVTHGIYCIPFYVNPSVAIKTGATKEDLNLFKFITPYVYKHTTSAIRPQISILHAWCAEHKNTLGSCPEHLLLNALYPSVKEDISEPCSLNDYVIPTLETERLKALKDRFGTIEDLNETSWN